jgi:hypothetical protein
VSDYWDVIETALTALPPSSPYRDEALWCFDHLKDRVQANGSPRKAKEALAEIRRLCAEGHGDDLIAETADRALAVSPADTTEGTG